MSTIRQFYRKLRNRLMPDAMVVRAQYQERLGRVLDLHNPKGLHEKICWLKLYGMTPLHAFCSDKILAPAYIASILGPGHTARRIFATYDLSKVNGSNIAATSCVVKANHDWNSVFLVEDTATEDWAALRDKLDRKLRRDFYRAMRERQYKGMRPGVVVEEMLRMPDGGPLPEMKMFCMHGRVQYVQVINDGMKSEIKRRSFVDRDWNLLEANRLTQPFTVVPTAPPPYLAQMREMAEKVSAPFSFMRVDFFGLPDRPVMGELTFTPTAGYDIHLPDSFELAMGARLDPTAPVQNWQALLAAAKAHVPDEARII